MAQSDRSRFSVGDRVRDRQTGEDGRVVDIRVFADGALLVTVAFFVGKAIRKKTDYRIIPGQIAHSFIEKIVTNVSSSPSSTLITSPQQGGSPSSRAIEKALRNEPPDVNQEKQPLEALKRSMRARGVLLHEVTQARRQVGDTLHSIQQSSQTFLVPHPFTHGRKVPKGHSAIDNLFLINVVTAQVSDAFESAVESEFRDVRTQLVRSLREVPPHIRRKARDPKTGKLMLGRLAINEGLVNSGLDEILKRHTSLEAVLERANDSIVDQHEILESIQESLQSLRQQRSEVLLRRKSVDTLLEYITQRGTRDEQGRFVGGYLSELFIPGRRRGGVPTARATAKLLELEGILRETGITSEFAAQHSLPSTITTGRDLLAHIRREATELSTAHLSEHWYTKGGYADLLVGAIRSGYSPYLDATTILSQTDEQIEQLRDLASNWTSDPLLMDYLSPVRQNADFVEAAKPVLERELDVFDSPSRTLTEQGVVAGDINPYELTAEVNRRLRYAYAGRSGVPHGTVRAKDIPIGVNPLSLFDAPIKNAGRLVSFQGAYYTISEIISDPATRGFWLDPVNTGTSLSVPYNFEDPTFLRRLAQIGTQPGIVPPASPAVNAAQVAVNAGRIIGVRGGLLNRSSKVVGIPANVLAAYIMGDLPTGEVSDDLVQSLGFASRAQFEHAFNRNSPRAWAKLQESFYTTIDPDRMDIEDLFASARSSLIESIHGIEEGKTVEEIAVLARQRAQKSLQQVMKEEARQAKGFGKVVSLQDPAFFTEEGDAIPFEDIVSRIDADASMMPMSQGEFQFRLKNWRNLFRERRVALDDIPFKDAYKAALRNVLPETIEEAFGVSDLSLERRSRAGGIAKRWLSELALAERRLQELMSNASSAIDDTELQNIAFANVRKREMRLAKTLGFELFDETPTLAQKFRIYQQLRKTYGDADPRVKEAARDLAQFQTAEVASLRSQASLIALETASSEVPDLRKWLEQIRSAVMLGQPEEDVLGNLPGMDFRKRKSIVRQMIATLGMLESDDPVVRDRGMTNLLSFGKLWGNRVRVDALFGGVATVTQRNWEQFRNIHDPLIQIAELEGVAGRLSGLPIEWGATPQGLPGIVMRSGDTPYLYREGKAFRVGDLSQSVSLDASERVFVHAGEYVEAFQEGQFRMFGKSRTAMAAEASALQPAVTDDRLPLFRSKTGRIIGATHAPGIQTDSLIRNTKDLFSAKEGYKFIGLDIETDINTGKIWNIAFQQYQKTDGKFVPTDFYEDVFVGDQALLAHAKTKARRGGYEFNPRVIAQTEAEAIETAVGRLREGLKESVVAGYNIGFDITALIQRSEALGLDTSTPHLKALAQTNLADVMLGMHALETGQKSLALEQVVQREVPGHMLNQSGGLRKQPHVARPDLAEMVKVINAVEGRHAEIASVLDVQGFDTTKLVWDREKRRAYRILGGLDIEKAKEILAGQTGKVPDITAGIALQPIDFLTGEATDAVEARYARTPHGLANMFSTKFSMHEEREIQALMQETSADLARRRVRRVFAGKGSFKNLLSEMERLSLANAAAESETALLSARNQMIDRLMSSESPLEVETLTRTLHWAEKYLEDSRITSQLVQENQVFQEEILGRHGRVIDWLKQSVEMARDPREGLQAADEVWNEYIRRTEEISDWKRLDPSLIPIEERQLAFDIPTLGNNKRAIRIGTRELIERDITRLTQSIVGRWAREDPNRLLNLMSGSTADALAQLQAILADKDAKVLDYSVGDELTKKIWDKELRPAIAGGMFQVGGLTSDPVSLKSKSMAEAIDELHSLGNLFAQSAAVHVPDQLTPRNFDVEALARLQSEFTAGSLEGAVTELANNPRNLRFSRRHGVPNIMEGQLVADYVDRYRNLTGGEAETFRGTLKRAFSRMSLFERKQLAQIFGVDMTELTNQVFQKTSVPERMVPTAAEILAGPADTQFSVGRLQDISEKISTRVSESKVTGKAALGVGAALLAGMGLTAALMSRPQTPTTHSDAEEGIASSDKERERRRQRVLQQSPQANRVSITISGEDPTGADHEELIKSVHGALGNFFGREIGHHANIADQRSKIDSDYLDGVATRLMNQ